MSETQMMTLILLVALVSGCPDTPVCPLEGSWSVEELGCKGGSRGPQEPLDATYTFDGAQGHTRWVLPGCTVEAQFELQTDGAEIRVRETQHTCSVTDAPTGNSTPCCESGPVDLSLTYTCRASQRDMSWMANLQRDGDEGPWAGRGPWRGCHPGDVGMMRLKRR